MNTKRGILSVIPALAVIAALLLLWTQETVLAAEQTYTIDDETSYEELKAALRNTSNSKISFDDDIKTITVDFDGIRSFNMTTISTRIKLSQQAEDFVNELFANSGNLKSVELKRVRLEGIQLQNLSNKTSMETLKIIDCGLDSFPDIKLGELLYLDVSENPFGNSDTVERYLTDSNFGELYTLVMHNCSFTSVPDIKLSKLRYLIMSENDFSAAGACDNLNATNFPGVVSVFLDGCRISDVDFLLTGRIGRQLTVLSLATNHLTDDSLNGLIALKNELAYLQDLNVGCKVWTGSVHTTSGNGYNANKITDMQKLASLFTEFPALTSLDVSGLGITSLQEFSYVENLGRTVTLYADYNKITDFAGLENQSGNSIYLDHQSITLPGKFNPGEEYEIPALIQRILDPNDALKGTSLSYLNCSLSDDGTKLVIRPNVGGAYVTVNGGKLRDSKIEFSLRRIPSYTIPQGLTATVGDTLAKVTLPSGFTWKDATMDVGAEGTNTFEAVYTPQDTDLYATVSVNIPVKVTDPNKPTEPTEPAKPTEPATDPTEPESPAEPTEPATKPTEPTEPVTDPTNPIEPTSPVEPTEPATEPTKPVEPTAESSEEYDDADEDETEAAAAAFAAKTSDTSPVVPIAVLLLVSGVVLCITVLDKKKTM